MSTKRGGEEMEAAVVQSLGRLWRTIHTPLQRRFGAGVFVVPDLYYYVPPDIDGLLQDLTQGNYCILCGARQSGKTMSVLAAKQPLSSEPDAATVVYMGGLTSAGASWDRRILWSYFWDSLCLKCPQLFAPRNATRICGELNILSLFSINTLLCSVTVVLDEASTLFNLPTTCIDEFFHVIRLMKNEPHSYNLRGFLLVGTERDLLQAHRYKRIKDADKKGQVYGFTPSMLSPFPHDHVVSTTNFSLEDVKSLLNQAAADRPGVDIDVDVIVDSIMQWTWGHKGLTGTCLAYLVQEELWKFKDWINRAEFYRLGTYVFGQDTYSRIMSYVREQVHNGDIYYLLVKPLELGEMLCEPDTLIELWELIVQGVLGADVDPPPNPAIMDRKIKALISEAYPTVGARVLPEAKEVKVQSRRRSQLQLDTLICDGDSFSKLKFGIELVASGSKNAIAEHLERAEKYRQLHSAQVFVLNVHNNKAKEELLYQSHDSVVFVSVYVDVHNNSSEVTFLDIHGTIEVVNLSLKRWKETLSFAY
ncbi:hypothetical protein L7F22_009431 [Adiantum nelumboides]|nr:hypothetical protein [Adiantum nelumboides]